MRCLVICGGANPHPFLAEGEDDSPNPLTAGRAVVDDEAAAVDALSVLECAEADDGGAGQVARHRVVGRRERRRHPGDDGKLEKVGIRHRPVILFPLRGHRGEM